MIPCKSRTSLSVFFNNGETHCTVFYIALLLHVYDNKTKQTYNCDLKMTQSFQCNHCYSINIPTAPITSSKNSRSSAMLQII